MTKLLSSLFGTLKLYPTIIASSVIILGLVALSIYAVVAIPYDKAVSLWRGAEEIWIDTPRYAAPEWTNLFRRDKLPLTFTLYSDSENSVTTVGENSTETITEFTFTYDYKTFPREMNVFFDAQFDKRQPYIMIAWLTPDGREVSMFRGGIRSSHRYPISQDTSLTTHAPDQLPHVVLLADPASLKDAAAEPEVLPGEYTLRIRTLTFDEGSTVQSRFTVYGDVYGMAGTDHRRRDLMVALLWGTPIALLFGLFATIGTSILTFIIAAIGTWYGGWLDAAIQRITEVNLMLPFLPILIMVGTFYSRSIWLMLVVIIVLGIFTAAIKGYRAMFLQVKNSAYIEAARAYGASNMRIIFRYMIPKLVPVLVPTFVIGIPAFVFLEASLAVIGLGDPILPTWGKVLSDAYQGGALYRGYYYWVLEPAVLLMATGLAFAMLGFALDRVFNPRLRGI